MLAASFSLFYADDISFTILSEKSGQIKIRCSTGAEVKRDGCHTSCVIADNQSGIRMVLFKTGIIYAGEWMDELLRFYALELPKKPHRSKQFITRHGSS